MKRTFSIFFAFIILLSGLDLTISTHFCAGKIAAVKIGTEGVTASCGMVKSIKNSPLHSVILSSDCCRDASHIMLVDNYQTTPIFEIQKANFTLLQVIVTPILQLSDFSFLKRNSFTDGGFYNSLLSLTERLTFICVFRK